MYVKANLVKQRNIILYLAQAIMNPPWSVKTNDQGFQSWLLVKITNYFMISADYPGELFTHSAENDGISAT